MERSIIREAYPYGDGFNSVEEFASAVDIRIKNGLSAYGVAIIYIDGERIGARANDVGDITVGAHCEWL
ncbi:MAG: hypothetical protein GYA62_10750 [Bacteroidales bacterium]|nr:hypothetical protein [Bacteroidales bacterium]